MTDKTEHSRDVMIVYEGNSCVELPSGSRFATLDDFFAILSKGSYPSKGCFSFSLGQNGFKLRLPRWKLLWGMVNMWVLVEVRDECGLRIPEWKLIELYEAYVRCREEYFRSIRQYRPVNGPHGFRRGPAWDGAKRNRRRRHRPALVGEITAGSDVDLEEYELKPRRNRSPRVLTDAYREFRGKGRRGNGWKCHRETQWRE